MMDTYIWLGTIFAVILFSVWRMKQEYRRGYEKGHYEGANQILKEWKQHIGMTTGEED